MTAAHQEAIERLDAEGLLRRARTVTPLPDGRCRVDGRELWNFTTNDYLNLAGDPHLVEAAKAALDDCGVGARASALVSGRTEWHERLEQRIADFEGTEAALLFPTGYAANVGTLTALLRAEDVVFCDRANHASLVDGCRTGDARFRVYRHDALDRLANELEKPTERGGAKWIVTDGVFSMDGTLAPLPQLCDLARECGASILVDEAHGTGVFGNHGRGASEEWNVEDDVDVRVGTLSKAVGCLGGFVAGSCDLVEWLRNTARPQIYSTALPPSLCAAATVAFDLIEGEPERRRTLLERSERFRNRLTEFGVDVVANGRGPIVPILLGEPDRVVEIGGRLSECGFLVSTIRPPTVPRGTSRLRVSLTLAHDDDVLEQLAVAIRDACR